MGHYARMHGIEFGLHIAEYLDFNVSSTAQHSPRSKTHNGCFFSESSQFIFFRVGRFVSSDCALNRTGFTRANFLELHTDDVTANSKETTRTIHF